VILGSFLVVGLMSGSFVAAGGLDSDEPVPLKTANDPDLPRITEGAGATRLLYSDETEMGELPATAPSDTSDPVADVVLAEMLDDPVVASRLNAAGVTGNRQTRAETIANAGLVIETTIRPSIAEAASSAAIDEATGLSTVVASADPRTGEVLALSGPVGIIERAASSVFKPVVMAAALESGVPADELLEAPSSLTVDQGGGIDWTVQNFGGNDLGDLTMADALARGANTPWAGLVGDGRLDPTAVIDMASRFGVDLSPSQSEPPPAVGSVVLGVLPLRPTDLLDAYVTIAQAGERPRLHIVGRILTADGELVYDAPSGGNATRAVDAAVAREVRRGLEQSICCGSGADGKVADRENQFGPVGRTQDSADAWFAGSTPSLTTVVWVGKLDGSAIDPGDSTTSPARVWRTVSAAGTDDTEEFP